MDIEARIQQAFRSLGERNTQPRQTIARSLIRLGRTGAAFSAEDLLKRLRRSHSGIGRATVYRSIDKLVRMKVLDRIEFADGSHSFRLCESDGHHHHLACTRCHRVIELDLCVQEEQLAAIGRREGFRIDYHSITLFGLCQDCRR